MSGDTASIPVIEHDGWHYWYSQPRFDPLASFTRGAAAPYVFKTPNADPVLVTCVRHKTDLATTKFGVVHRVVAVAGVMEDSKRIRFAARWACGRYSPDVTLIPDADSLNRCIACEDKADPEPNVVYRCFGGEGDLLYIGSTFQRRVRFKAHARNSPWWSRVADIKLQPFPTINEARLAELAAIYAEDPPCNRQGRRAA